MSGHSKWSQIKHKKALTDAKKGRLFSKVLREITVAAREGGSNEEANPRLRSAIGRAREAGLPRDNIERALARATGKGGETDLQEFLYEVMGPGGAHVLVEGITDNKNRTLGELKQIISKHDAKLVPPNSLLWNFEKVRNGEGVDYRPRTTFEPPPEVREKLVRFLEELADHNDVQEVYTNLDEGIANRI